MPGFIFGEEDLVEFLAWADTDDLDVAVRRDDFRKISYSHTGDLGNKDLSAPHRLDAMSDESGALFKCQPEACHALVRDCHAPLLSLLQEERYDASPASNHIPVAVQANRVFLPPA